MLARGMAGWHVTQTPFDLICVGGGDTLYACNSRGVMHVSYHDPQSPREVLAKAIQDICAGHADKALVDAMAGAAGVRRGLMKALTFGLLAVEHIASRTQVLRAGSAATAAG